MRYTFILGLFSLLFVSCQEEVSKEKPMEKVEEVRLVFQNKGHELVYHSVQKMGDYQKLKSLKDVVYTYTYRTAEGQEDVSVERYIFDGELSLGVYSKHERTFPEMKGEMIQYYNGKQAWMTIDGKEQTDEKAVGRAHFTRKTNFFWFAMMQKMLDPGVVYKYLREEQLNGVAYDVVEMGYDVPKGQVSDIYHLYINKTNQMVDQFLFTVADFGKVEQPLLMKVKFEKINGLVLPTYRQYTKAKWDGTVLKEEWVEEICTDVKFNQQLKKADFSL